MYEICAFANIRRAPRTAWDLLLNTKIGGGSNFVAAEFFHGTRPDGSDVYMVRKTIVTAAGGDATAAEFSDKFDALDAYNDIAGVNVVVA